VELTSEQQEVANSLVSKADTVRVQTLGGYAGTGKTTIIRVLAQRLRDFQICAPTGKAAHVLRKKGCQAKTVHSAIYYPINTELAVEKATENLERLIRRGAGREEILLATQAVNDAKKPHFEKREELPEEIEGIIVDEASMVSQKMFDDLLSFEVPLIFVGDHGQLPPVVSKGCEPFNIMDDPMYRLETIHRNAGPIAFFAEHIRKGGNPRRYGQNNNTVQILGKQAETTKLLMSADQVICPFNRSRVERNDKIRRALGRKGLLVEGDRIICLRNAEREGLFNGLQGVVTRVDLEDYILDFEDDEGILHVDVEFEPEQFGKEEPPWKDYPRFFDYGYVITCHKSQGSEWPHVLVLDQGWKNDYSRWAYTAASRARKRLTWITR
jgi:ATP-dependent exoDNAse (exonuclease V) alpha subunit